VPTAWNTAVDVLEFDILGVGWWAASALGLTDSHLVASQEGATALPLKQVELLTKVTVCPIDGFSGITFILTIG
jgi:hypothetical protein